MSEAITNINNGDATSYPECTGTGAFGVTDTISIPEGTVTLTTDLPHIEMSLTVSGAGMGNTIINGAGAYSIFNADKENGDFTFEDFTVSAYSTEAAIYTSSGNVTVARIEVDGTGSSFSAGASGLSLTNINGTTDNTVEINDVYVHGIHFAAGAGNVIGIGTSGSATTTVLARNITIEDIINTQNSGVVNAFIVGVSIFGGSPGSEGITGNVSNITIHNIQASTANGFGLLGIARGYDNTSSNVTLNNATLSSINSPAGAPVFVGGAGFNSGDIGSSHLTMRNVLLADNDSHTSCATADITSVFGGSGTGNGSITSQGGNLSDDNSCKDFFTQSSDRTNVTTLGSTLGSLSDNGGYVPTISLLQGSPAIDAGITVTGLTTDARGAVRPQGSAYDSGAYESPYTKPVASLADTGESTTLYVLLSAIMSTVGLGILALKLNRS